LQDVCIYDNFWPQKIPWFVGGVLFGILTRYPTQGIGPGAQCYLDFFPNGTPDGKNNGRLERESSQVLVKAGFPGNEVGK